MVFFGTLSLFSYEVLSELLNLKTNIKHIVLAKDAPDKIRTNADFHVSLIQTFKHKTIELLAIERDIPIIYVQNIDDPQFFSQIKACKADFFVIACFPYLIPRSICELAKLSSLNIHPSLLPAFRGPSPLFWQLKAGRNIVGVTIHKLNQQFDLGRILLQSAVSLKDGMRGRAIDRLLAYSAAQMLVSLVASYRPALTDTEADNETITTENSGYFPTPKTKDFIIPLTWPAKRAFNFMRGTEEWNLAYPIAIDSKQFFLSRALAYTPAGRQQLPYHTEANIITIRMAQGLLQASLKV